MVPCETEILLKKFNLTKIHRQKFELHEVQQTVPVICNPAEEVLFGIVTLSLDCIGYHLHKLEHLNLHYK